MIYDDVNKKWMPSGTSSGLSKVHVFQHQVNNTFRVVGRKLQNQEVRLDYSIVLLRHLFSMKEIFEPENLAVFRANYDSLTDLNL